MSYRCEICNAELMLPGACDLCGHDPADAFDIDADDTNAEAPNSVSYGGDDVIVGSGPVTETLRSTPANAPRTGFEEEQTLHDLEQSDISGEASGFLDGATSADIRIVVPAAVHIDRSTQALLEPDCVLRPKPGFDPSGLSVFERVVFDTLNGERPNARVGRKTKLGIGDLKIALALLADRGAIELAGHAKAKEDSESGPAAPAPVKPRTAAPPSPVNTALREDSVDGFMKLPGFDEPSVVPDSLDVPPAIIDVDLPLTPRQQPMRKPRDVELYEEAHEAELQGDYDRALMLLRTALKFNPNAAPVHNRLGVLMATRLHEVSKGMDSISKAIDLDPNNQTYRNNLTKIMVYTDEAPPEDSGGLMSRLFKKK